MSEETNYNHHLSNEKHFQNEYECIQEQLQSDYKTYCNHCQGEPLSLDNWTHCHINEVSIEDDLPF